MVVHCSDGWDRTAQVCSVAALMLDPFYRTIKGFQTLIEKDWLSFGHKFTERCGHIQGDLKEMSPVFTQFLDCTFQMMAQRIDAFEFNERFLLTLHDDVQSCQYGTFIGNCEKDRLDLRLSDSTYSLWGYMANHLNEYINPLYRPEMDEMLRPELSPQVIRFWRGMYGRFESGVHPREPLGDLLLSSRDHCSSLEDHVQHLTKVISNNNIFDFFLLSTPPPPLLYFQNFEPPPHMGGLKCQIALNRYSRQTRLCPSKISM